MVIMTKPYLILVRGIPGSGKSYVTEILAERLGIAACVVLDPDAIDYESQSYKTMVEELRSEGVDEKFYPYRFLRRQAHEGIENNQIIIWNQAFTNLDGFQKTIRNLTNHAKQHGKSLPLLVVEVEIDAELAKQRVAERAAGGGHDVPSEHFDRFTRDYVSFENEGYSVIKVDGAGDIEAQIKEIIARLQADA